MSQYLSVEERTANALMMLALSNMRAYGLLIFDDPHLCKPDDDQWVTQAKSRFVRNEEKYAHLGYFATKAIWLRDHHPYRPLRSHPSEEVDILIDLLKLCDIEKQSNHEIDPFVRSIKAIDRNHLIKFTHDETERL